MQETQHSKTQIDTPKFTCFLQINKLNLHTLWNFCGFHWAQILAWILAKVIEWNNKKCFWDSSRGLPIISQTKNLQVSIKFYNYSRALNYYALSRQQSNNTQRNIEIIAKHSSTRTLESQYEIQFLLFFVTHTNFRSYIRFHRKN